MKIYFGFTVAGDRSSIDAARKVVAMLQEKGHEVLPEHLVHDNAWSQDRLIPAQQVYQRDMNWLNQCDLFIAEVSGSSFGLGFEAGYLLGGTSKRVLLFYRRDLGKKVSSLITGNTHPNCTLIPYAAVAEVGAHHGGSAVPGIGFTGSRFRSGFVQRRGPAGRNRGGIITVPQAAGLR